MGNKIDRLFLAASSILLVCGVSLGLHMGMTQDFMLAPVHGHLNLLGWVSLALFGIAYRSFPELGSPATRFIHLLISVGGAALFPLGLYFELTQGAGGLIILASVLWLSGALLFCGLAVAHALKSSREHEEELGTAIAE